MRVIIEFSAETIACIDAVADNRSKFIREAMAWYLADLERKRRDCELAEGYREYAETDRQIARDSGG